MRVFLIAAMAALLAPVGWADTATPVSATIAVDAERLPVWQPAGGEQIRFDVLRKGKPFGTHNLDFSVREDGTLEVVNDIDLQVKVGPITAYRYRHDSVEEWQDGQLQSLTGETRKEGKDLEVTVSDAPDGLAIDGTNFDGLVAPDVIPSSHWHSGEVFSDAILSSEGGQMLPIRVDNLGADTVTVAGDDIQATKFRLYSDLTVDLWYDADGRWVKCAFEARGQTIEYVLQALY